MKDNTDVIVGDPEKRVGLNHLESLIDHGSAVNGNALSHFPGGMRQHLALGEPAKVLFAIRGKRAAGSGKIYPAKLAVGTGAWMPCVQELEERVNLAVDRQNFGVAFASPLKHKTAGSDNRFLIGERNALGVRQVSQQGLKRRDSGNCHER